MLRNIWTFALVLFFVLMTSTFVIRTVWQATVMIALVGVCWAVACWVPFAMMMEFLKELDAQGQRPPAHAHAHAHASAGASGASGASQPPAHTVSYGTMDSPAGSVRSTRSHPESPTRARPGLKSRSYSATDLEGAGAEYITHGPVAGGTIMGIHNLAIVLPQFIVSRGGSQAGSAPAALPGAQLFRSLPRGLSRPDISVRGLPDSGPRFCFSGAWRRGQVRDETRR